MKTKFLRKLKWMGIMVNAPNSCLLMLSWSSKWH
jgi:hypothetical protein